MTFYLNRERTTHWLEDNEQWIEDHKDNMISLATTLFVNMQIILLINSNYNALGGSEMPSPYSDFMDSLSALTFDFVQMVPADCMGVGRWTHMDSLLLNTLTPLGLLACVGLLLGIRRYDQKHQRPEPEEDYVDSTADASSRRVRFASNGVVASSSSSSSSASSLSLKKKSDEANTVFGYSMQALLLVLPAVSRKIAQTFPCNHFDGSRRVRLAVDLDVNCESQSYETMKIYAGIMIAVYPVTMLQYVLLTRHLCHMLSWSDLGWGTAGLLRLAPPVSTSPGPTWKVRKARALHAEG